MNRKISIIIPTFHEELNINNLIKKIRLYLPSATIYIIDDSKNNLTKNSIKFKKLIKYFHRKNKKGRGSAVLYGLRQSLLDKNKLFIEMDSDFSHDPKELNKNLKIFIKQKLDLLIASRYLKKSKIINWPLSRRVLSYLSNMLAKILLRVPVSDYTNGFRFYSLRAVKLILKKSGKIGDGFIILSEILYLINLKKYKISETSTIFLNRSKGKSSVNFKLIIFSFLGLIKLFLQKKRYN